MTATAVLVPGAFCGSWIFWRILPELHARGVAAIAVDLPTVGAADRGVDVRDDIAHVDEVVASVKGEVLLVGSSYGGAVITGVDRASVIRLVYVAAVMPTANDSVFATLGGACWPEFTAGIHPVEGGLFGMDLEVGVHRAFQQADAAAHDEWRGHAKSMSFGADLGLAVGRAGWERTPSTYVVCSEDLSVKPEQQRVWAQERATEMLEFPFDHSPGVSHPAEMADVIARLAAG